MGNALFIVWRETIEAMLVVGILHGWLSARPAAGFVLALAAYWLLSRGSRFVSWRAFFRVTEVLLLLLGGALLVDGAEKLVGLGALPPLADPLWSTASLLDDGTRAGGLVAAFTGYRAAPSGMAYALLTVYWALALGVLLKLKPKRWNT